MEKPARRSRASRADRGAAGQRTVPGRRYSPFVAGAATALAIVSGYGAVQYLLFMPGIPPELRQATDFWFPVLLCLFFLFLRHLVVSQGRTPTKRSWRAIGKRRQKVDADREAVSAVPPLAALQTTPVKEDTPVMPVGRVL